MCDRSKRCLVFSEEKCGFSFKEASKKEYECGMCKLEMMIEGERMRRMELNGKVNVLVACRRKTICQTSPLAIG